MRQWMVLFAVVCAPVAQAQTQEWSEFSRAFPAFPCPDGWSGCVVENARVQPDMIPESTGVPMPANARIGWFDMKPTAAFSAFVDLSEYTGPRTERAPVEAPPVAEPLPEPVDDDAAVDAVVVPVPTPEPQPEPVPVPVEADCAVDRLVELELTAVVGQLDPKIAAACEASMATLKMTDRDAVSRLLMKDAYARGDRGTWSALVVHHLTEIDQSDPDMAYKYALYLSQKMPGTANDVIRWSTVAGQNKREWEGEVHVQRVNALHRLRATASASLWQQAEQAHLAAPSDETASKVAKYRNLAKVEAREWLEYATNAGKDPRPARQLCVSAAGTEDYCVLD